MKKTIMMLLYSSSFSLAFSTGSDSWYEYVLQYVRSQPLIELAYTCPNYTPEELELKATKALKNPKALQQQKVSYYFSEEDEEAPVDAHFILTHETLAKHPTNESCKRLKELFEETKKKIEEESYARGKK